MRSTESHMYAFNKNPMCMHLTRITKCMHLTESHVYVFNRITHVCIEQNHTCMHLTESQSVCI